MTLGGGGGSYAERRGVYNRQENLEGTIRIKCTCKERLRS